MILEETKNNREARRAARRKQKQQQELERIRRAFSQETDKLIQEYAKAKDLSYAGAVAAIAERFPHVLDDPIQWPGRNLLKEAKAALFGTTKMAAKKRQTKMTDVQMRAYRNESSKIIQDFAKQENLTFNEALARIVQRIPYFMDDPRIYPDQDILAEARAALIK
jgi:hypothetical protein